MPYRARDIALETALAMTAATFMVLGMLGLLAFAVGLSYPLRSVLVPDAALAALLGGTGLLACTFAWHRTRRLAGAVLMVLVLYSLFQELIVPESGSWLTGRERIVPAASSVLLGVALCLMLGIRGRVLRRLWAGVGLTLTGLGVISLGVLLLGGDNLWTEVYVSSPMAATLCLLICGLAMGLMAQRGERQALQVGRMAILAGLLGIVLSGSAWYLLSWQYQDSKRQQASYVLDNIQLNTEQMMASQLLLVQRMAERLEAAQGRFEQTVLERDIRNYLRDAPGLQAIGLLNAQGARVWGQGRDDPAWDWLGRTLIDSRVEAWLDLDFPQPRLLLPDDEAAQMALMAMPVMTSGHRLVASLDMAILLDEQLRVQLGTHLVRIHRDDQTLLEIRAPGRTAAPSESLFPRLEQRHVGLPGGIMLTLEVFPDSARDMLEADLVPGGVGIAGLMLSYLLAYSLGLAQLVLGRSRELAAAHRYLEAQQGIQASIARDAPLEETLRRVCRMLEQQIPGALCSVMQRRGEKHLVLMSGDSLPPAFREALGEIEIGADVGACGSSAFRRETVICEDILSDTRWQGFHAIAAAAELRACWSCPVIASDGRVLGTFATYYRVIGSPDEHELEQIHKAAELVALAIERQQDRHSLWQSEQRYRSLFAYNPDAVFSLDPMGHVDTANATCGEITGLDNEAIIGTHFSQLIQPEDVARSQWQFETACAGKTARFELSLINRDGEERMLDLTILPIMVEGRIQGVYGIAKDISDRKVYEAQLAHHASHDALTGLANRSLFEDRLAHDFALACRHGYCLAVLFVDLDDFKPINDSLGHALGDKVLIEVANRLTTGIRTGDTLARLGGDEFVVLLPDLTDEQQALQMAERLLSLIAQPYCINDLELHLTCSIGIAVSDGDTEHSMMLIQQADMAMYRAKRQGRNAYQWFTREITAKVNERVALRNELQEAIDKQQLELHYQPLLDREGEVVSVEALLRWKHPAKGYIPPDVFIPLAEETGQIMPISQWVLERACLDMGHLEASGYGALRVAVNLSPLQFHRSGFLTTLSETLTTTGLPAGRLELELTEGILMNDTEAAIEILHALRGMGIEVSIDDFGTGFSSLSYLKHLPIGKVKIDRSFVKELARRADDAAIAQGIISMAHHLGLDVVAEGIETSEQHGLLLRYGCDVFQGFLLARPMPLARLEEFLAQRVVV
ncbi:EAL domain-containing protein [Halomonas jincaotanensis]|uniref:EAL domain-containing protein n=1 Tax=Halomonas jincaotanensis TaxID=2810616 RepID=UPI002022FAE1|nr:EAL domain-containing protein [Halomonas jincaotanensis]